jgi:tRNA threonylcarbamoyladenosine biosynthesis protein TsaB
VYLLLIDSTKTEMTVAVAKDGQIVAKETNSEQRTHDKTINALVKKCGVSLKNLNAVAVVVGPGSWTGIRVGLAMAKSYSYALKIPIIELTDGIDLTAAITEYHKKNFVNAFTAKPLYNGDFVVRKK